MLSYLELKRIVGILEPDLSGTTVHRVVQPDDFSLALSFRGGSADLIVFLSCRPELARLSLAPEMPKAPSVPGSLGQYARAHLLRAAFVGVTLAPANRQVSIRLETAAGIHELLLSILGARSNLYILDADGRVVHTMRPLAETRRELVLGGRWKDPEGALPSEGRDRWPGLAGRALLEEVERAYRKLESARQIEALSRRLENTLAREAAFLARKSANLLEDLGEAREAQEHRRKGELLKGALGSIRLGDESVSLIDYETGMKVAIPLDSALTPAQNLEAYFKRYRKELRSVAAVESQIAAVRKSQSELEALDAGLHDLNASPAPSLEALREFADKPRVRQLLRRHFPEVKPNAPMKAPAGKKEIPARLRPKRYMSTGRLEIWVGRSDEGNDYLTTRLARGNDIFFHLEGYPGSHVVLRTEGRVDPPAESVLEACELAAHFSRLKGSARADVHMAYVKDIRKPKGAKPGLVYVSRGKTIHLRSDPKRLESILASRLDD